MRKYPIYKQDNEYSCGAYCIKMILKYYHRDIIIKEIKERCRLTTAGISVYGMIQCLKSYHFDAKAYQCDIKILLAEAKLPCIIHVINDNMTHFMVLYKVTKNYLIIGDPGKGLIKLTVEELETIYTGVCICIEHVGRYTIEKYQKDMSFSEFVIKHLQRNYQNAIKLLIRAIIISGLSIFGSFYFQGLINMIVEVDYYAIVGFSGIFIFAMVMRVWIDFQRRNLEIEIEKKLNYEYVNQVVVKMIYLPFRYLYHNRDGILLTRVQNLFSLSNFFIRLYTIVFMDMILMLGIIIALFILSFEMGLIVITVMVLVGILVLKKMQELKESNKKIISSQEKMNSGYLEYLKNFYNSHQFFLKRFVQEKVNFLFDKYNYHILYRDKQFNILNATSEVLIQLTAFLIILVASFYYKQGEIKIGDIILFYMLTTYLFEPLFNVLGFLVEKDEIMIVFERYKEIIPVKKEKKMLIKGRIKEIKFDHITYSYGYTKPVLEHLDLTINHSLWLKGDTGAGKSTLLKLLMKHDDLVKGDILINGISIDKIDLNSLYRKIIYLDKEPIFYQESLRFNMLLKGKNEKMMNDLLKEFMILELEKRLDILMEVDGRPLSSGQRQIVMLIRALLLKPEVLILDEALSNVDDEKMLRILNYLYQQRQEIIVVIVAHQTKLVNQFYDCVIIKEGKIENEV